MVIPEIDFTNTISVVLQSVRETLLKIQKINIERGGVAQPFAPLSKSTIKRKKYGNVRADWIHKPLLRYGKLYNNLFAEIKGQDVVMGSKVSYAKFHLYGTKRMPQRDFTQYHELMFKSMFNEFIPQIVETVVNDVMMGLKEIEKNEKKS